MSKQLRKGTKVKVTADGIDHFFNKGQIVTYWGKNPFGGNNFTGIHNINGNEVEQWLQPNDYEILTD
ncbi:hypothetical protein PANI_CDS0019 [Maribacter phage Panino]